MVETELKKKCFLMHFPSIFNVTRFNQHQCTASLIYGITVPGFGKMRFTFPAFFHRFLTRLNQHQFSASLTNGITSHGFGEMRVTSHAGWTQNARLFKPAIPDSGNAESLSAKQSPPPLPHSQSRLQGYYYLYWLYATFLII